MGNPIVGSAFGLTLGMLKDFYRQLDDGSIKAWQLQAFLDHRENPFTAFPDISWLNTYEALGLKDQYVEMMSTHFVVPKDDPFLWFLPMPSGATSNKIVDGCRKLGVRHNVGSLNLDTLVPNHQRDVTQHGPYMVVFRRNVEADKENEHLSASTLQSKGHEGITFPERLLLGAAFYVATGQHLDEKTRTLCSGSRSHEGSVPVVDWDPDNRMINFDLLSPGYHEPGLRSRSVVSFITTAMSSLQ